MIELDPRVRDHFMVLEPHETFEGYAKTYGDAIAEHYEARGVVIVPMPITLDLDFIRQVQFPAPWKKIGTLNGIEKPVRSGTQVDPNHPFVAYFRDVAFAERLQSQIARANQQLRLALRTLFPRYRTLQEMVITWRLRETRNEGMHLDVFNNGLPLPAGAKSWMRIKFFLNIDAQPRRWRTSLDLPEILRHGRRSLPDELPDDLNVVNDLVDKLGVLDDAPAHRVAYPTLSAVFANAEVVAHEVVYGHRVIGGEFFCPASEMLSPARSPHACLQRWLTDAGYRVAPDAAAVAARHAHLKGIYQRRQALAAGPG